MLRRSHRIQPGADADFNIRNAADLLSTFNETAPAIAAPPPPTIHKFG